MGLFEHREIGRDAGGDGVFLEQAGAETVDGGDPGSFDGFAMLGRVGEALDETLLDFGGGFFGEGDGQDAAGVDVMEFDQPGEAFD